MRAVFRELGGDDATGGHFPPQHRELRGADRQMGGDRLRESLIASLPRLKFKLPPLGVGLAIAWLALMVVLALGADFLTPFSITAFDLKARLNEPLQSMRHLLGTDELGRDVLSRLIVSIRISLLIALFGTMIAATLGTGLGLLAAHFRGRVEQFVLVAIDSPSIQQIGVWPWPRQLHAARS